MNNAYSCLSQQKFIYNSYHVEPYRFEDLFLIKEWRNQQIDVLRQKKMLTDDDQLNYYRKFIEPSFGEANPKIILFSFCANDQLIGYGGLTNCSWEDKRSELSFLVCPERHVDGTTYREDFSAFIRLMKQVNFDTLQFNRLFAETYDIRPLHISILEENGFQLEGRMRQHVFIHGVYTDSLLHGILKKDYYVQG